MSDAVLSDEGGHLHRCVLGGIICVEGDGGRLVAVGSDVIKHLLEMDVLPSFCNGREGKGLFSDGALKGTDVKGLIEAWGFAGTPYVCKDVLERLRVCPLNGFDSRG